jgi:hypothetical protein
VFLNLSRKQYHKAKTLLPYFFSKLIRLSSFERKISTKVLGMVVCYENVLCNGTESQHKLATHHFCFGRGKNFTSSY